MGEWELRKYWTVIRKRIWWTISIPILSTALGIVLCFYVLTPQYEAQTSLLIGNVQTSNPTVQYQAIMTNQALVQTYTNIIRSSTVEQAVINHLKLPLTTNQLDRMMHVVSPDGSQIIQISVLAPNPRLSVNVANAFGQVFKQQVKSLNIPTIQVIAPATLPKHPTPVKPNKRLDITLAAVIGVVLALAWVFLLEGLDNRLKSDEDVYKYLNMHVLGSIVEYRQ